MLRIKSMIVMAATVVMVTTVMATTVTVMATTNATKNHQSTNFVPSYVASVHQASAKQLSRRSYWLEIPTAGGGKIQMSLANKVQRFRLLPSNSFWMFAHDGHQPI